MGKIESALNGVNEGTAIVAAIRNVLDKVQRVLDKEFSRLKDISTCSREFLSFLDGIEESVTREMASYGFKRIHVPRRSEKDIIVGFYMYDAIVVEIGLKELNQCGVLSEITGGKPPRVYAKLYLGGRAAIVLESSEQGEDKEEERTTYIM